MLEKVTTRYYFKLWHKIQVIKLSLTFSLSKFCHTFDMLSECITIYQVYSHSTCITCDSYSEVPWQLNRSPSGIFLAGNWNDSNRECNRQKPTSFELNLILKGNGKKHPNSLVKNKTKLIGNLFVIS